MKKRIALGLAVSMMFVFLLSVTAFAATTPTTGIEELTTSLTNEIGTIIPVIVASVGSVIGAIAPSAMQLAGMVILVGLVIGTFRRLLGR